MTRRIVSEEHVALCRALKSSVKAVRTIMRPSIGPCAKLTTIATIVAPNGERFVGTNWVRHPQRVCPREGMPTGVGYELCKSICDQPAHAEVSACLAAGEKARGGTLYLEGHYYACEPCKRVCAEHGVIEIVIGAPPEAA